MQVHTKDPTLRYVVLSSAARMPASVKAPYRRIAVVELRTPCEYPGMISTRSRAIKSIVYQYERRFVGRTQQSAFYVALADALNKAEDLNKACA